MKRRLLNMRKYPPNRIENARKAIFESGQSVGYKGPLEILKDGSWAPTRVCFAFISAFALPMKLLQNAYHTELGLDPCPLMVPDLMHDYELGVERHKFLHDLRIFHAAGKGIIQEFDTRSVLSKVEARFFFDRLQLSSGSNIWTRYHPEVRRECLRIETAYCEILRGHSPSESTCQTLSFNRKLKASAVLHTSD